MHHHSSHPRIPEALRPYIGLPRRDTLTLVTGILGATTNWIVLRFIAAAAAYNNDDIKSTRPGIDDAFASEKDESEELGNSQISNRWSGNEKIGEQNEAAKKKTMGSAGDRRRKGEVAVVLVSWMRDVDFWRTEGMKAVVSLDLKFEFDYLAGWITCIHALKVVEGERNCLKYISLVGTRFIYAILIFGIM